MVTAIGRFQRLGDGAWFAFPEDRPELLCNTQTGGEETGGQLEAGWWARAEERRTLRTQLPTRAAPALEVESKVTLQTASHWILLEVPGWAGQVVPLYHYEQRWPGERCSQLDLGEQRLEPRYWCLSWAIISPPPLPVMGL